MSIISNPIQSDPAGASNTESVSVLTLTQSRQLLNADPRILDLTNPSSSQVELFLPNNPTSGRSFLILNSELSTGNFKVNTLIIPPGDRLEIVWNGTIWREI